MIKKLSHIAVAVPNVDEAAKAYKLLGLSMGGKETVPGRKVTVGFIPVGETRIELVQPTSPDSPIAKFLEQRGPGLQHICLEVDDIDAEFKRLTEAGVRMVDKSPQPGAHGSKVCFIH